MTDMNIIRRKMDRKLSKHYDILINDKKVKIINFKIKNFSDDISNGKVLEPISKLKLDKAPTGDAIIKINKEKDKFTVKGIWKYGWDGPGNHGVAYLILE